MRGLLRGIRSWEGTDLEQLTQTGQRDVPYHVLSKSWAKGGRRNIQNDCICLPEKQLREMSPAFLGMAEHLPAHGNRTDKFFVMMCLHIQLCFT